ncbi:MAG: (2Fe-2S)-binding protein [Nitrospirae bacterium]|nr:(2Fe-2S)-binding protein [Nitrospirota bacterium]MBI3351395.1 (2Fe-2S)-binding protein [Nitrospirota bacterium]
MEEKVRMHINDHEVEVKPGTSILAASMKAGIKHMHLCGGRGLCTTCRVHVVEGEDNLSKMENFERISLRAHLSFSGEVRLACQAKVLGPLKVKTIFPTIGRLDFKGQ